MSRVEVDKIQQQCGSTLTVGGGASKTVTVDATTVTLGRCGGTVSLASGATQSGFGRTGTVDWVTTIQTSTPFTAVSGKGYFINTTSGAITMNLPSSPSVGDIVSFKDYARTFDDNNLTVGRGGSNMDGAASDTIFGTEGLSATLIYMDGTKGWSLINDDATTQTGAAFVTATGGTITTVCTNYKVHTFTGPGTFTVSCAGNSQGSNTVSYMVIAGGGGGALGTGVNDRGGGGGAGGYREGKASSDSYTASPLNAPAGLPVSAQGYPIVVGAGGAQKGGFGMGNCGSVSTFSTVTSTGGGGGGRANPTSAGGTGGSGGGGGGGDTSGQAGAAGNTPPVSPPQGNNGGTGGGTTPNIGGGGGGGATVVGGNAVSGGGGNGGTGATTSINGTPTERAGGGGGDKCAGSSGGGASGPGACQAGTVNTGGGGQGGHPCGGGNGSAGGSGIVIIRYKYQ